MPSVSSSTTLLTRIFKLNLAANADLLTSFWRLVLLKFPQLWFYACCLHVLLTFNEEKYRTLDLDWRTVNRNIILIEAVFMRLVAVKFRLNWRWILNSSLGVLRGGMWHVLFHWRWMMQTVINRKEYCHQTESVYSQHQEGRSKETLILHWTVLTMLQEGSYPPESTERLGGISNWIGSCF
jgi:hypothetical protein